MRKYIFARVISKIDSSNISDAIENLIKKFPDEDISAQIQNEKIVLVDAILIPSIKKFKTRHPFEYCKKCQKMHRKNSADWKRCLKPEKEGSISL